MLLDLQPVIRLHRPGLETSAALLAGGGWLAVSIATGALAGSWWWSMVGLGTLGIAAGAVAFWWARTRAALAAAAEAGAAGIGPRRIAR